MTQERVTVEKKVRSRKEPVPQAPGQKADPHADLKQKLDDLLEEVDEILQSEGVEQLVNFRQSGGQ